MSLPNLLTLSRIFLSFIFMFCVVSAGFFSKALALFIFLLASLTDYWDGRLARHLQQITNFGKLMDPIADKFLSLSAFLAFVQLGIIPAWMAILVIARDFLVTGFRLMIPDGVCSQTPRSSGKHKTALQFASIIGVLLFLVMEETPFWKAEWTPWALDFIYYSLFFIVLLTLWSGVRYVMKNKEVLDDCLG
jgi:CDP-diacylglycerol---glycerol-3-phosphate 3-phosphatidyltransferase